MPANPVQPHAEKKRVAKEAMEAVGIRGVIEPFTSEATIPDNTELFGNAVTEDVKLPYNHLPNGWGITYVKCDEYGGVFVGVGPV